MNKRKMSIVTPDLMYWNLPPWLVLANVTTLFALDLVNDNVEEREIVDVEYEEISSAEALDSGVCIIPKLKQNDI